ncbi:MAG: transcription-repair coupling factor [Sphingobacteriaceae bacterium]|nr:transcription-repair coupling factor [Sphingobacteriaceae bacterium]
MFSGTKPNRVFDSYLKDFDTVKIRQLSGFNGSSFAFFVASYFSNFSNSCILIASDKESAAYLQNDLESLMPNEKILFFPESSKMPYTLEKTTNASIQERTEIMNLIARDNFKGILVTYPQAICEKTAHKQRLKENTLEVKIGEKLSPDFISEFLMESKFNHVDFVFEPGQYSVRGGIIDIFSFANEYPYRIELFGNEIEAIKTFDPVSQLSNATFNFITIIPNLSNDSFAEHRVTALNYFNAENCLLFIENEKLLLEVCEDKYSSAQKIFQSHTGEIQQLPPNELIANAAELQNDLEKFRKIVYGIAENSNEQVLIFNQQPQPSFHKNFDLLLQNLKENKSKGYTNYFTTHNNRQAERLNSIFNDLLAKEHRTADSIILQVPLNIHQGFIDHHLKIAVYTDHEVFDRYHRFKLRESKNKNAEAFTLKELLLLQPGDYVTHIDHGIGRFAGLQKLNINGKTQENVKLLFKDNDTLYVNIHSLHRISKYSGKEGTVPKINKLGSAAWAALKQKTKKNVKAIAFDLIKLYAERKTRPGHAFPHDNYLQHELEASFLFEDTPDQIKVSAEVKKDMEKPNPMDRLICGDVGFGKTEIAIRAAFKAVCDSKQVAVLVPTTILAYQHYKTFSDRLANLPANVEYISRFKTAKQQTEIFKKLQEGKIDIIIGTHKLAAKQIKFKDLGLLIIDEEQKFGVGVKDKLKTLKTNIDTLTLTATPIPRTLQFSLMGARDLSVISTPPANRYPVQTELHSFDEELIRDAISYELNRGGQVFFVNNNIQNLDVIAGTIRRLVPKAKVVTGHGQMKGEDLEEVMLGFMEGDYDVLVATTIIESGLDISNANTIIINDAQNFGLSDLHQMRGRVGRSNKKAYCYLLAPSQLVLTDEARKRLKAIVDFSDLGSGFQIAMRDLDIRGAGNLLGGEQSGFINEMGFDTYMKVLNEAIEELKEENWFKEIAEADNTNNTGVFSRQFVKETIIETDFQLLIPDAYVSSTTERLVLYRELDNIMNEQDLLQFETSIRDRFGPIPPETKELINVVRIRWLAMKLGFEKVVLKNNKMLTYFLSKQNSEYFNTPIFTAALQFAQKNPSLCKVKEQNNRLWLIIEDVSSVKRTIEILDRISELTSLEFKSE